MRMKKGEEDELITIHGIRMGFSYWSGHFYCMHYFHYLASPQKQVG